MHRVAVVRKPLCGVPENSAGQRLQRESEAYSDRMSCAALLAIIDDTRLTPTEKVVFGCIIKGYQKRAEIARAAHCGESTVPRAVRKLISLGLLERHEEAGKPNRYVIVADTGIAGDTPTHTDTRIAQVTAILAAPRTPKQTQDVVVGIATDTGISPPYDINSTPQEVYPERAEASFDSGVSPLKILNGSAKGMPAYQLASKLIEIIDSPSLASRNGKLHSTCGEVRAWIDDGADFDSDVVPTVADLCSRKGGKPILSWKYFTEAVRDAATTRLAIEERNLNPIGVGQAHEQRTHDTRIQRRPRSAVEAILSDIGRRPD